MLGRGFEPLIALLFNQGIGRIPTDLMVVAVGPHEAIHLGALGPRTDHHSAFKGLDRSDTGPNGITGLGAAGVTDQLDASQSHGGSNG